MTQPNPDQEAAAKKAAAEEAAKKAAAEEAAKKAAAEKAAAEVDVLDVVGYIHRDPIFGGETRQVGVVVAVEGQAVHVVPLAGHRVQVTPDDVERLTLDDLTDDDDDDDDV